MATKHGLGRGLKALIQDQTPPSAPAVAPVTPSRVSSAGDPPSGSAIRKVSVTQIKPSPWQPRRHFAPEALEDLVNSIRERGVLQPLLVRKIAGAFELIAGERRWRAAQAAELAEVPVIVMEANDNQALEIALVENLQRQDLNVIEEAEGYQALIDKFNLTQDDIARRVGKARASIANTLRLLNLPVMVRQYLAENLLTSGHAKALLGLEIAEEQVQLAERIVREGRSVRDAEKWVAALKRKPAKPRAIQGGLPDDHVRRLSELLHQHFGTGVHLEPCRTLANGKKTRGSIKIDLYSDDDLDRILQILGLQEQP